MAAGFSITITAVDGASNRIENINKRLAEMRAPVDRLSKQLSTFSRLSGLQSVANGFQRMAQGAYQAFQSIARIIAPLGAIAGAASVAGMYRLVEAWAQFGQNLRYAATQIGIPIDKLQAFRGAAALTGASADAMSSSLQGLGQTMYDAIGGRNAEAMGLFTQLGIAIDDGSRHAKSADGVFKKLADAVAAAKDPFTQLRIVTASGISPAMLPLLRQGAKGIDEYLAAARKYAPFSSAAADAAQRMALAQEKLTLSVTGLGNSISERLAPIIAPLLTQMADWIAANRGWISTGIADQVKVLADYISQIDWKAVVGDMRGMWHTADSVAKAFGGWKTVLEGIVVIKLASWAAGAIGPIASLIRLLSFIPGSGVTAGAAAVAVGGTVALTGAGIGDSDDNPHARFRVSRPGQNVYPPSAGGVPPGAAASAIAYFQKMGWSPAQAAGLAANIQSESGFRANITGDGGAAYGLGQWHADRQANFKKWAGKDIRDSTYDEQLAFYNYELTSGAEQAAGRRLRSANSAYDAGAIVSRFDERPAAADEAADNRGRLAAALASGTPGAAGASGTVQAHITVAAAPGTQVSKVTASGSGNVAPPKIATTQVGSASGV